MPEPLQMRGDPHLFAVDLEPREGGLLHRVGGQDGLGHLLKMIGFRAQPRPPEPGKRRNQLLGRQRHADDSCRRWKHFLRPAAEHSRRGFARGAGRIQASLAHRAVGVAGVDGHHAHFAAGGAQMLLVHQQRARRSRDWP